MKNQHSLVMFQESLHSEYTRKKYTQLVGMFKDYHKIQDFDGILKFEQSEIFGVSHKDTLEYVDYQKRLRKIINDLTLEKALEIGISRREFFYLKRKLESTDKPLRLKEKILIRLNNFI